LKTIERRGLIFSPPGIGWCSSHAQNPFGQDLGGGRVRVHFTCRDTHNRSHGACLDMTWQGLVSPEATISLEPTMTLGLGALGTFDDSGAMPSSIVEKNGTYYLYYTGWSLASTVPFSFHIGLAQSVDGLSYTRVSEAPVLGRGFYDPYITGAPWVCIEGGIFRMWYISGTAWERATDGSVRHYYTIKYAESYDGITWKTSDHRCIYYGPGEYALARPVVYFQDGKYQMLFSFRGGNGTYRIGSASSGDGISWQRTESIFLDVAAEGWDSQMVCYGWSFQYAGQNFLLYIGNNYGKDGFGVVRL